MIIPTNATIENLTKNLRNYPPPIQNRLLLYQMIKSIHYCQSYYYILFHLLEYHEELYDQQHYLFEPT